MMTLYWIIKTYFLLIGTFTSAIKLTTSSDRATAGMDFNFTCISNDVFVTFTRNHIDECENLGINSDGSCRFLEECNSNYTISCNFDNYTLTIPGSFDINTIHESTWSCSSYFGERISNEIKLYVNVPITRVSIQSYPSGDDNPIKIVQGSRQRFTCASDGGRPASRIQWYLSGTNITGDSKGQTDICNPGCNGKVISSSALEYIGDNVDNRKKIYCTAVNIVGHIVRSYYIDIVILYGPMISAISDQIIQEGNTLRVISNIDANPVSMLVWWSSSSELSFRQYGPVFIIRNIQRTYSGYYTCHSMNTLIPSGQPSQNRTSVKRFYVSVQYPPSVTIVPSYNPYILYERQQNIVFSCVIDANPSSNITYNWHYPDGSMSGKFLTIPTVIRGNSGLYSCNATNSVGTSKVTAIQLEIQYEPVISVIHGNNITEGQTLYISPIIDSYPSPTYIWWTRQNDDSFLHIGTPLQIYNIQTKDSDNYTCIVMNTLTPSGLPSQNRTSHRVFNVYVQLLSANKAVKTNTIGIWFGSSLVALMAIAITGLCVYKYRKRQVPNVEENTNNRVYESTRNVQRNTTEADQHLYNDIQVIESDVENQKKKIDESFNTYEDIWDVRSKRPDHVYQNMKISDKEEKMQQKEKAINVNLELKPSIFT